MFRFFVGKINIRAHDISLGKRKRRGDFLSAEDNRIGSSFALSAEKKNSKVLPILWCRVTMRGADWQVRNMGEMQR